MLLQSAKYQLGETPYLRKHEGTCCAPTSPGLMPEILPLAIDFSGSKVLKEASLDQQQRPGSGLDSSPPPPYLQNQMLWRWGPALGFNKPSTCSDAS